MEYLYLQGILYVLYCDLSSKVYILGISHLTPFIWVGFQISISYTSLSTANAQLIQNTIRSERKICSTMKQMNPYPAIIAAIASIIIIIVCLYFFIYHYLRKTLNTASIALLTLMPSARKSLLRISSIE